MKTIFTDCLVVVLLFGISGMAFAVPDGGGDHITTRDSVIGPVDDSVIVGRNNHGQVAGGDIIQNDVRGGIHTQGGDAEASAKAVGIKGDVKTEVSTTFVSETEVPPFPPIVPGNRFVQAPQKAVIYSNKNKEDLDGITWTKLSQLKKNAKPPKALGGLLFFCDDWNAAFEISVSLVPVVVPEGKKIVPSCGITTYNLKEHGSYIGDIITIDCNEYVRIADVTGDAKKEGINENRVVTASTWKGKSDNDSKHAAVFVYEVFTNPANTGETGTLGGGSNFIGGGPLSANVIVSSVTKGLTREVGVSGITGTFYALLESTE